MFHGLLQEEAELCSWLEPKNLPRFRCWWANLRPYSMEYVKNRTKYRISCVLGTKVGSSDFFVENLGYNSIAVNLLLPCCMWGWGYKSFSGQAGDPLNQSQPILLHGRKRFLGVMLGKLNKIRRWRSKVLLAMMCGNSDTVIIVYECLWPLHTVDCKP